MSKIISIPSRTTVIRLDLVDRDPGQPRKTFNQETIEGLARNIEANGLLNPIYLRPNPATPGRYILVAGERRFRALRLLGVEEFEFKVVEKGLPPYVISIIENGHRENLNAIEEAESYRECMEREKMTVAELSEYTGKHFTEIYRALRLLKLSPEVQQLVREGKLNKGNLKYFAQFKNLSKQIELAQRLIRGEDPPELIEAAITTNGWSEERIIAALPKTAQGLIRYMLEFRRRASRIGYVFDTFLKLSEAEQMRGWTAFTKATRENFTSELIAFAAKLERFNKGMEALPETQKAPFGPGASSNKEQQPAAPPPVPPAPPPPPAPKPPARAPLPRPTLAPAPVPAAAKPGPKPAPTQPPTDTAIQTGEKVINFLANALQRKSGVLLSRGSLAKVLGNGNPPADVEKLALTGLRAIRDTWRSSPMENESKWRRDFVITVSRYRYELGFDRFEDLVRAIKGRDRSPDPINLERL